MNKKYVSPVCRLIEVAPQMGICQIVSPYSPGGILNPGENQNPTPQGPGL